MRTSSRTLRRDALEKIAALSVQCSSTFAKSDLERLCDKVSVEGRRAPKTNGHHEGPAMSLASMPMSIKEFDVLLALCKAAPQLQTSESATQLAHKLVPYLLEAHSQVYVDSPAFRDITPCPGEVLTSHLVSALLCLGIRHEGVQDEVRRAIATYLDNCSVVADNALDSTNHATGEIQESIHVATLVTSLLGFLSAAATYTNFWSVPERLELLGRANAILSEKALVVVETAISTIRNSQDHQVSLKEWKKYCRQYSSSGRPLGAMLLQRGLMQLLVAAAALLVYDHRILRHRDILEIMLDTTKMENGDAFPNGTADDRSVEVMLDLATHQMNLLEEGADYLRLGSTWQQRLAFSVKAAAIKAYVVCATRGEDSADIDALTTWLEDTLADNAQMADDLLASTVLRSVALLAKLNITFGNQAVRLLSRFIVQGNVRGNTVTIVSHCLGDILRRLPQDATITTLYTLGNVLSSSAATNGTVHAEPVVDGASNTQLYQGKLSTGSSISLAISGEEETLLAHANVIRAICLVAANCDDAKITALAQSMLLQKIQKVSRAVDAHIITEAASLAMSGGPQEFKSLLKLYVRLAENAATQSNELMLLSVMRGRNLIAGTLERDSPLHEIYLGHLLDTIISSGDAHQGQAPSANDPDQTASKIAYLLKPLALLLSKQGRSTNAKLDEETSAKLRDAWFNMVIHGFNAATDRGMKYHNELKVMAVNSQPLVAEQRGDQVESDIELNTVLRRRTGFDHEANQKKQLSELLPSRAADIRSLSYRKVVFLHAAYLMETLRAESGDFTAAIIYFLEPSMRLGDMSKTMEAIAFSVLTAYLSKTTGAVHPSFAAPSVARQLVQLFCNCCHRIERVQQVAFACADKVIHEVPSSLCQKSSLFALCELLSLLWTSCLEAETDEYAWKSTFTSSRGRVTVELSDDFELRQRTLDKLYHKAREWVTTVIHNAPLDVKGLLQTYLSDFVDDGAYGHISFGRSFACEMGALIPGTDQRLVAMKQDNNKHVNTASDFIAQYTTRQEYRYAEPLPEHDAEWVHLLNRNEQRASVTNKTEGEADDAETSLAQLHARLDSGAYVPIGEQRDILRRAAALLCRSKTDQGAIIHHLVAIPFRVFSKPSIKLGISLWLGVMNENPRMESRILMETLNQWEDTVHKRLGIFNDKFKYPDPFNVRAEFAPSDRAALTRQQQAAHDLIVPHMRLLQFFASHFNATRLSSIHTEKAFLRLVDSTLSGLRHAAGHPLTREIRFQMVALSLRVLRFAVSLSFDAKCRLKNEILSAALAWFAFPPRWSFGGNRLQLKAEARLLADVSTSLRLAELSEPPSSPNSRELAAKEELLQILIRHESARLGVWLFPMHEAARTEISPSNIKMPTEAQLLPLARTAWLEQPSLAIQLAARFPYPRLLAEVRSMLMRKPEHAISEPDALHMLLQGHLPADLNGHMKYLLYWAPVNPISAVSYFSPAYGSHPLVLQYAMRALEFHPVNVTFFYVPQIVQTLRYDALGYVERYIIETARTSQLFAHQIIWNMKANAYKDDDAKIPDSLKPTLDRVTEKMKASFSTVDRKFFEREFAFFDEVTSISGKLKPYIQAPKEEKKQKIEEELRKIVVEVGVYLPSNPDGVVIGIDRKSGKPLQSHAKAPYMATFRIAKAAKSIEGNDQVLETVNRKDQLPEASTIEVWQSAIFKVGDDCRQDVLALQMIAAFRSIFNDVGLDVYVFPYRVTATAPGCGVIDVLPNSVSRDMLGREAVNGLYDYFISKYGNEDSPRFQEARNNFVKSMAAYSVISFLLQFKDRHNGNIMIDDAGHILHIDFGFCFDIAPGGIRFERAPFKLTQEMVAVMGGRTDHQAYKWFEELSIKAFLASRQHVEKLAQMVLLMLDSGLPCFKPVTIQHFKDRFVLERSEAGAADFMRDLIRKSHASYSTKGYDQFQLWTNGIPY